MRVAAEECQDPFSVGGGIARPRRRRARVTPTYATLSASAISGSGAAPVSQAVKVMVRWPGRRG